MKYIHRAQRASLHTAIPLLLATGSLGLMAILWRRRSAPRAEEQLRDRHWNQFTGTSAPPSGEGTQAADDGTGVLVHRRYEVSLPDRAMSRDIVMRLMQLHLTELAPAALANFEKSEGLDSVFRVDDEYEITMLGPWNGKVRVTEMLPDSFTLVTLEGHPEAGHITFSVDDDVEQPGNLRARIESWARARDSLVEVAYGTLGIGKQVQTEVWVTFLQRLSVLAGVTTRPEVHITTENIPQSADGEDRDA